MKILIIGAAGQDGSILAENYYANGHDVVGVRSRQGGAACQGFEVLDIDFSNRNESVSLMQRFRPDRVFHLAAVHSSSALIDIPPERTQNNIYLCNVEMTRNILDWQRVDSNCKSVIGLSSQMYSLEKSGRLIDETAEFAPQNYYGETKVAALSLIRKYRRLYETQSFGAILFNHTSNRSKPEFLFPQLVIKMGQILRGESKTLVLREPDAELDISHASEICNALMEIAELGESSDFVLASGGCIKIRDLISNVFLSLSFNGDYQIQRGAEELTSTTGLIGDSSKAFRVFGWKVHLTPEEILVKMLQDARM